MNKDDLVALKEHGVWLGEPVANLSKDRIHRIFSKARKIYAGTKDIEQKKIAGGVLVWFGERFFFHMTPGRETFKDRTFT